MEVYKSKSGKASGVTGYEMGEDYITVQFGGANAYTYTYALNGKAIIDKMKKMALSSKGLSTFISRNKERLRYQL